MVSPVPPAPPPVPGVDPATGQPTGGLLNGDDWGEFLGNVLAQFNPFPFDDPFSIKAAAEAYRSAARAAEALHETSKGVATDQFNAWPDGVGFIAKARLEGHSGQLPQLATAKFQVADMLEQYAAAVLQAQLETAYTLFEMFTPWKYVKFLAKLIPGVGKFLRQIESDTAGRLARIILGAKSMTQTGAFHLRRFQQAGIGQSGRAGLAKRTGVGMTQEARQEGMTQGVATGGSDLAGLDDQAGVPEEEQRSNVEQVVTGGVLGGGSDPISRMVLAGRRGTDPVISRWIPNDTGRSAFGGFVANYPASTTASSGYEAYQLANDGDQNTSFGWSNLREQLQNGASASTIGGLAGLSGGLNRSMLDSNWLQNQTDLLPATDNAGASANGGPPGPPAAANGPGAAGGTNGNPAGTNAPAAGAPGGEAGLPPGEAGTNQGTAQQLGAPLGNGVAPGAAGDSAAGPPGDGQGSAGSGDGTAGGAPVTGTGAGAGAAATTGTSGSVQPGSAPASHQPGNGQEHLGQDGREIGRADVDTHETAGEAGQHGSVDAGGGPATNDPGTSVSEGVTPETDGDGATAPQDSEAEGTGSAAGSDNDGGTTADTGGRDGESSATTGPGQSSETTAGGGPAGTAGTGSSETSFGSAQQVSERDAGTVAIGGSTAAGALAASSQGAGTNSAATPGTAGSATSNSRGVDTATGQSTTDGSYTAAPGGVEGRDSKQEIDHLTSENFAERWQVFRDQVATALDENASVAIDVSNLTPEQAEQVRAYVTEAVSGRAEPTARVTLTGEATASDAAESADSDQLPADESYADESPAAQEPEQARAPATPSGPVLGEFARLVAERWGRAFSPHEDGKPGHWVDGNRSYTAIEGLTGADFGGRARTKAKLYPRLRDAVDGSDVVVVDVSRLTVRQQRQLRQIVTESGKSFLEKVVFVDSATTDSATAEGDLAGRLARQSGRELWLRRGGEPHQWIDERGRHYSSVEGITGADLGRHSERNPAFGKLLAALESADVVPVDVSRLNHTEISQLRKLVDRSGRRFSDAVVLVGTTAEGEFANRVARQWRRHVWQGPGEAHGRWLDQYGWRYAAIEGLTEETFDPRRDSDALEERMREAASAADAVPVDVSGLSDAQVEQVRAIADRVGQEHGGRIRLVGADPAEQSIPDEAPPAAQRESALAGNATPVLGTHAADGDARVRAAPKTIEKIADRLLRRTDPTTWEAADVTVRPLLDGDGKQMHGPGGHPVYLVRDVRTGAEHEAVVVAGRPDDPDPHKPATYRTADRSERHDPGRVRVVYTVSDRLLNDGVKPTLVYEFSKVSRQLANAAGTRPEHSPAPEAEAARARLRAVGTDAERTVPWWRLKERASRRQAQADWTELARDMGLLEGQFARTPRRGGPSWAARRIDVPPAQQARLAAWRPRVARPSLDAYVDGALAGEHPDFEVSGAAKQRLADAGFTLEHSRLLRKSPRRGELWLHTVRGVDGETIRFVVDSEPFLQYARVRAAVAPLAEDDDSLLVVKLDERLPLDRAIEELAEGLRRGASTVPTVRSRLAAWQPTTARAGLETYVDDALAGEHPDPGVSHAVRQRLADAGLTLERSRWLRKPSRRGGLWLHTVRTASGATFQLVVDSERFSGESTRGATVDKLAEDGPEGPLLVVNLDSRLHGPNALDTLVRRLAEHLRPGQRGNAAPVPGSWALRPRVLGPRPDSDVLADVRQVLEDGDAAVWRVAELEFGAVTEAGDGTLRVRVTHGPTATVYDLAIRSGETADRLAIFEETGDPYSGIREFEITVSHRLCTEGVRPTLAHELGKLDFLLQHGIIRSAPTDSHLLQRDSGAAVAAEPAPTAQDEGRLWELRARGAAARQRVSWYDLKRQWQRGVARREFRLLAREMGLGPGQQDAGARRALLPRDLHDLVERLAGGLSRRERLAFEARLWGSETIRARADLDPGSDIDLPRAEGPFAGHVEQERRLILFRATATRGPALWLDDAGLTWRPVRLSAPAGVERLTVEELVAYLDEPLARADVVPVDVTDLSVAQVAHLKDLVAAARDDQGAPLRSRVLLVGHPQRRLVLHAVRLGADLTGIPAEARERDVPVETVLEQRAQRAYWRSPGGDATFAAALRAVLTELTEPRPHARGAEFLGLLEAELDLAALHRAVGGDLDAFRAALPIALRIGLPDTRELVESLIRDSGRARLASELRELWGPVPGGDSGRKPDLTEWARFFPPPQATVPTLRQLVRLFGLERPGELTRLLRLRDEELRASERLRRAVAGLAVDFFVDGAVTAEQRRNRLVEDAGTARERVVLRPATLLPANDLAGVGGVPTVQGEIDGLRDEARQVLRATAVSLVEQYYYAGSPRPHETVPEELVTAAMAVLYEEGVVAAASALRSWPGAVERDAPLLQHAGVLIDDPNQPSREQYYLLRELGLRAGWVTPGIDALRHAVERIGRHLGVPLLRAALSGLAGEPVSVDPAEVARTVSATFGLLPVRVIDGDGHEHIVDARGEDGVPFDEQGRHGPPIQLLHVVRGEGDSQTGHVLPVLPLPGDWDIGTGVSGNAAPVPGSWALRPKVLGPRADAEVLSDVRQVLTDGDAAAWRAAGIEFGPVTDLGDGRLRVRVTHAPTGLAYDLTLRAGDIAAHFGARFADRRAMFREVVPQAGVRAFEITVSHRLRASGVEPTLAHELGKLHVLMSGGTLTDRHLLQLDSDAEFDQQPDPTAQDHGRVWEARVKGAAAERTVPWYSPRRQWQRGAARREFRLLAREMGLVRGQESAETRRAMLPHDVRELVDRLVGPVSRDHRGAAAFHAALGNERVVRVRARLDPIAARRDAAARPGVPLQPALPSTDPAASGIRLGWLRQKAEQTPFFQQAQAVVRDMAARRREYAEALDEHTKVLREIDSGANWVRWQLHRLADITELDHDDARIAELVNDVLPALGLTTAGVQARGWQDSGGQPQPPPALAPAVTGLSGIDTLELVSDYYVGLLSRLEAANRRLVEAEANWSGAPNQAMARIRAARERAETDGLSPASARHIERVAEKEIAQLPRVPRPEHAGAPVAESRAGAAPGPARISASELKGVGRRFAALRREVEPRRRAAEQAYVDALAELRKAEAARLRHTGLVSDLGPAPAGRPDGAPVSASGNPLSDRLSAAAESLGGAQARLEAVLRDVETAARNRQEAHDEYVAAMAPLVTEAARQRVPAKTIARHARLSFDAVAGITGRAEQPPEFRGNARGLLNARMRLARRDGPDERSRARADRLARLDPDSEHVVDDLTSEGVSQRVAGELLRPRRREFFHDVVMHPEDFSAGRHVQYRKLLEWLRYEGRQSVLVASPVSRPGVGMAGASGPFYHSFINLMRMNIVFRNKVLDMHGKFSDVRFFDAWAHLPEELRWRWMPGVSGGRLDMPGIGDDLRAMAVLHPEIAVFIAEVAFDQEVVSHGAQRKASELLNPAWVKAVGKLVAAAELIRSDLDDPANELSHETLAKLASDLAVLFPEKELADLTELQLYDLLTEHRDQLKALLAAAGRNTEAESLETELPDVHNANAIDLFETISETGQVLVLRNDMGDARLKPNGLMKVVDPDERNLMPMGALLRDPRFSGATVVWTNLGVGDFTRLTVEHLDWLDYLLDSIDGNKHLSISGSVVAAARDDPEVRERLVRLILAHPDRLVFGSGSSIPQPGGHYLRQFNDLRWLLDDVEQREGGEEAVAKLMRDNFDRIRRDAVARVGQFAFNELHSGRWSDFLAQLSEDRQEKVRSWYAGQVAAGRAPQEGYQAKGPGRWRDNPHLRSRVRWLNAADARASEHVNSPKVIRTAYAAAWGDLRRDIEGWIRETIQQRWRERGHLRPAATARNLLREEAGPDGSRTVDTEAVIAGAHAREFTAAMPPGEGDGKIEQVVSGVRDAEDDQRKSHVDIRRLRRHWRRNMAIGWAATGVAAAGIAAGVATGAVPAAALTLGAAATTSAATFLVRGILSNAKVVHTWQVGAVQAELANRGWLSTEGAAWLAGVIRRNLPHEVNPGRLFAGVLRQSEDDFLATTEQFLRDYSAIVNLPLAEGTTARDRQELATAEVQRWLDTVNRDIGGSVAGMNDLNPHAGKLGKLFNTAVAGSWLLSLTSHVTQAAEATGLDLVATAGYAAMDLVFLAQAWPNMLAGWAGYDNSFRPLYRLLQNWLAFRLAALASVPLFLHSAFVADDWLMAFAALYFATASQYLSQSGRAMELRLDRQVRHSAPTVNYVFSTTLMGFGALLLFPGPVGITVGGTLLAIGPAYDVAWRIWSRTHVKLRRERPVYTAGEGSDNTRLTDVTPREDIEDLRRSVGRLSEAGKAHARLRAKVRAELARMRRAGLLGGSMARQQPPEGSDGLATGEFAQRLALLSGRELWQRTGGAPNQWIDAAGLRYTAVEGVTGADLRGQAPTILARLRRAAASTSGDVVPVDVSELTAAQVKVLRGFVRVLGNPAGGRVVLVGTSPDRPRPHPGKRPSGPRGAPGVATPGSREPEPDADTEAELRERYALNVGARRTMLPYAEELAAWLNDRFGRLDNRVSAQEVAYQLVADWQQLTAPEGWRFEIRGEWFHIRLELYEPTDVLDPVDPKTQLHIKLPRGPEPDVRTTTSREITVQLPVAEPVTKGASAQRSWTRSLKVAVDSGSHAESNIAAQVNEGESSVRESRATLIVEPEDPATGERDPATTFSETADGEPDTVRIDVAKAHLDAPPPTDDLRTNADAASREQMPHAVVQYLNGLETLVDDVIGQLPPTVRRTAELRRQAWVQVAQLQGRLHLAVRSGYTFAIEQDGHLVAIARIRTTVLRDTAKPLGGWRPGLVLERVKVAFEQLGFGLEHGGSLAQSAGTTGGTLAGFPLPGALRKSLSTEGSRTRSWTSKLVVGLHAIRVHVDRWVGHSQAYQIGLEHAVTVRPTGDSTAREAHTVAGEFVGRFSEPDAWRYGLPISKDAVDEHGRGLVRGTPEKDGDTPEPTFPEHVRGVTAPGSVAKLRVTDPPSTPDSDVGTTPGGEDPDGDGMAVLRDQILDALVEQSAVHDPDDAERPLPRRYPQAARDLRVLNRQLIEQQITSDMLESRFDKLSQDGVGIWLWLVAPGTGAFEHVEVRLRLDRTGAEFLGYQTENVEGNLDVGQSSLGEVTTGGREVGWTGRVLAAFGRGRTRSASASTTNRANKLPLMEKKGGARSAVFAIQGELTAEVRSGKPGGSDPTTITRQVAAETTIPESLLPRQEPQRVTTGSTPVAALAHTNLAVSSVDVSGLEGEVLAALHDAAEGVPGADALLTDPATPATVSAASSVDLVRAYFEQLVESGVRFDVGAVGMERHQHHVRIGAKRVDGDRSRLAGETDFLGKHDDQLQGDIFLDLPAQSTSTSQGRSRTGTLEGEGAAARAEGTSVSAGAGGGYTSARGTNQYSDQVRASEEIAVRLDRRFEFSSEVTLLVETGVTQGSDPKGGQEPAGLDGSRELRVRVHWNITETDAINLYADNQLDLPASEVQESLQRWLDGMVRLPADRVAKAAERLGASATDSDLLPRIAAALDSGRGNSKPSPGKRLPAYLGRGIGLGPLIGIQGIFGSRNEQLGLDERVRELLSAVAGEKAAELAGWGPGMDGPLTDSRLPGLADDAYGHEFPIYTGELSVGGRTEQYVVSAEIQPAQPQAGQDTRTEADGTADGAAGGPKIVAEIDQVTENQQYDYLTEQLSRAYSGLASFTGKANHQPVQGGEGQGELPGFSAGGTRGSTTTSGDTSQDIHLAWSAYNGPTYVVEQPVTIILKVTRRPVHHTWAGRLVGAVADRPAVTETDRITDAKIRLTVPKDLVDNPPPEPESVDHRPIRTLPHVFNLGATEVVPLQDAVRRLLAQPRFFGRKARFEAGVLIRRALTPGTLRSVAGKVTAPLGGKLFSVHSRTSPGERVDVRTKLTFRDPVVVRRLPENAGLGMIDRHEDLISFTTEGTSGGDLTVTGEFGAASDAAGSTVDESLPELTPGFGGARRVAHSARQQTGLRREAGTHMLGRVLQVRVRYSATFDVSKYARPADSRMPSAEEGPWTRVEHVVVDHAAQGEAYLLVYERDLPELLRSIEESDADQELADQADQAATGSYGTPSEDELAARFDEAYWRRASTHDLDALLSEVDPAGELALRERYPAAARALRGLLPDPLDAPPLRPATVVPWRWNLWPVPGELAPLRLTSTVPPGLGPPAESRLREARLQEARGIAAELGRDVRLEITLSDGSVASHVVNPNGEARQVGRVAVPALPPELQVRADLRRLDLAELYEAAVRSGTPFETVVAKATNPAATQAALHGVDVDAVVAGVPGDRGRELQDTQRVTDRKADLEEAFGDPVSETVEVAASQAEALQHATWDAATLREPRLVAFHEALREAGLTRDDLLRALPAEPGRRSLAAEYRLAVANADDPVQALREAVLDRPEVPGPATLEGLAAVFGFDEPRLFRDVLTAAGVDLGPDARLTPAERTVLLDVAAHLAVRYGLDAGQRRQLLEVGPEWLAGQLVTRAPGSDPVAELLSAPDSAAYQRRGAAFERKLQWIIDRYFHAPAGDRAYRGPDVSAEYRARVRAALERGGVPHAARVAAELPGSAFTGDLSQEDFEFHTGDPNVPSGSQYRTLGHGGTPVWVPPGARNPFDAVAESLPGVEGSRLRTELREALEAELSQPAIQRPLWSLVNLLYDVNRRAALDSLNGDDVNPRLAARLLPLLARMHGLEITVVDAAGQAKVVGTSAPGTAPVRHVTLWRTGAGSRRHYMAVRNGTPFPVEVPEPGKVAQEPPGSALAARAGRQLGVVLSPVRGAAEEWVDEDGRVYRALAGWTEQRFDDWNDGVVRGLISGAYRMAPHAVLIDVSELRSDQRDGLRRLVDETLRGLAAEVRLALRSEGLPVPDGPLARKPVVLIGGPRVEPTPTSESEPEPGPEPEPEPAESPLARMAAHTLAVQLWRRPGGEAHEWVDQDGLRYTAIEDLTEDTFDELQLRGELQPRIEAALESGDVAPDFVPVDVSGLRPVQMAELRALLARSPRGERGATLPSERVLVFGEPRTPSLLDAMRAGVDTDAAPADPPRSRSEVLTDEALAAWRRSPAIDHRFAAALSDVLAEWRAAWRADVVPEGAEVYALAVAGVDPRALYDLVGGRIDGLWAVLPAALRDGMRAAADLWARRATEEAGRELPDPAQWTGALPEEPPALPDTVAGVAGLYGFGDTAGEHEVFLRSFGLLADEVESSPTLRAALVGLALDLALRGLWSPRARRALVLLDGGALRNALVVRPGTTSPSPTLPQDSDVASVLAEAAALPPAERERLLATARVLLQHFYYGQPLGEVGSAADQAPANALDVVVAVLYTRGVVAAASLVMSWPGAVDGGLSMWAAGTLTGEPAASEEQYRYLQENGMRAGWVASGGKALVHALWRAGKAAGVPARRLSRAAEAVAGQAVPPDAESVAEAVAEAFGGKVSVRVVEVDGSTVIRGDGPRIVLLHNHRDGEHHVLPALPHGTRADRTYATPRPDPTTDPESSAREGDERFKRYRWSLLPRLLPWFTKFWDPWDELEAPPPLEPFDPGPAGEPPTDDAPEPPAPEPPAGPPGTPEPKVPESPAVPTPRPRRPEPPPRDRSEEDAEEAGDSPGGGNEARNAGGKDSDNGESGDGGQGEGGDGGQGDGGDGGQGDGGDGGQGDGGDGDHDQPNPCPPRHLPGCCDPCCECCFVCCQVCAPGGLCRVPGCACHAVADEPVGPCCEVCASDGACRLPDRGCHARLGCGCDLPDCGCCFPEPGSGTVRPGCSHDVARWAARIQDAFGARRPAEDAWCTVYCVHSCAASDCAEVCGFPHAVRPDSGAFESREEADRRLAELRQRDRIPADAAVAEMRVPREVFEGLRNRNLVR